MSQHIEAAEQKTQPPLTRARWSTLADSVGLTKQVAQQKPGGKRLDDPDTDGMGQEAGEAEENSCTTFRLDPALQRTIYRPMHYFPYNT
jgi:hypothetical protein